MPEDDEFGFKRIEHHLSSLKDVMKTFPLIRLITILMLTIEVVVSISYLILGIYSGGRFLLILFCLLIPSLIVSQMIVHRKLAGEP